MSKDSQRTSREPLVIDLPDGQKLYVADLEEGMALEVATWRGVGEPDSRVARMIIAATKEERSMMVNDRHRTSDAREKDSKKRRGDGVEGPARDARTPVPSGRWSTYEEYIAEEAQQATPIDRRPGRKGWMRRAAAVATAAPVAAIIVAVLTGAIALAKPVPSLAAELKLGASSLLVALPQSQYAVGDEVLARVSIDSQQAAVVAQVVKVKGSAITVAAGGSLVELSQQQVIGRLAGTLPIGADLVDRPLLAAAMAGALILGLLLFAL